MIERNILSQKMKEFKIREFISKKFMKTGYSHTAIQKTPLGDKITIYTTRPGLVVGRKGENIKKLTIILKNKYRLENPQIEIGEVENPFFDAQSIAEKIAYSLEKFGSTRFKSIGYKTLQSIMDAGALGAEIHVAGKIPSARARTWRFVEGYLKKCGNVSDTEVIRGEATANLKSGAIGITVSIMPKTVTLPDKIVFKNSMEQVQPAEVKEEAPVKKPKEKKKQSKNEEKGSEKDKSS
ncbi:30S ribosomal protein S3 [Candidatus Woesearchaeota archaeon]|nr:30S ribosomal protein S3 [Candidatus Woesearchaeota archaeon]